MINKPVFSLRDLLGQSYDQKDVTVPNNNPIPQEASDNLVGSPISALLKAAQGQAPVSASGQAPLTPEQLQAGNTVVPEEAPAPVPAEKEIPATIQAPKSAVKEAFQATQSPEQKAAAQAAADAKNPLIDNEMTNALNTAKENRSANASRQALFEMMAGIGSLGGKTMSGASGALDQAIKTQDQPLTDINTQRDEYKKFLSNKEEREKADPNSPVSTVMRDALSGMGVKIPTNASYASMEKLAPQLMKNKEFQMKLEELGLRREELKAGKADKVSDKERYHQDSYLQFATSKTAPIRSSYSAIQNAARLSSTSTKNPAEDITALYSFVKNLDPNSSVREGEVGLARDIASIQGKVQTYFNKVAAGDSLDSSTVDNLKKEIKRMADSQKQSYETEMAAYKAGAKNRGIPEDRYVEFDPQHASAGNKIQTTSGIKKVTLKDGNVINIKESDLSQIDKADIAKVE